ncbi:unnamed protein product, partial [Rotaria magnacalcarata]
MLVSASATVDTIANKMSAVDIKSPSNK